SAWPCGDGPARCAARPVVLWLETLPAAGAGPVRALWWMPGRPALDPSCRLHDLPNPHAGEQSVIVIRCTRTLGGHHTRSNRGLRGTGRPEHLAFPGFQHALEHLTTLTGLGIGHAHAGDGEAAFSVKVSKGIPHLQRRVGDKPKATPLEVRTQF